MLQFRWSSSIIVLLHVLTTIVTNNLSMTSNIVTQHTLLLIPKFRKTNPLKKLHEVMKYSTHTVYLNCFQEMLKTLVLNATFNLSCI